MIKIDIDKKPSINKALIIVAVLLAFVFIGGLLENAFSGSAVQQQTNIICTDSDGGINPNVRGYVSIRGRQVDYLDYDECESISTLRELSCSNDRIGSPTYTRVRCLAGCRDNACINIPIKSIPIQKLQITESGESCQISNRRARNLYNDKTQQDLGWQCVFRETRTLPQYATFGLGNDYEVSKIIIYQTTLPSNEVKDVSIWISTDVWVPELASINPVIRETFVSGRFVKVAQKRLNQALGSRNEISFSPVSAKWVRIQVDSAYGMTGYGLSDVEINGRLTEINDSCKNTYGNFCIASNFCPQGSSPSPSLTCPPPGSSICCSPPLPSTAPRVFIDNVDQLFKNEKIPGFPIRLGFETGYIEVTTSLLAGTERTLYFNTDGKFFGYLRDKPITSLTLPYCDVLFLDIDNNGIVDELNYQNFDRDDSLEILLHSDFISKQEEFLRIQQSNAGELSGPPSRPGLDCYVVNGRLVH